MTTYIGLCGAMATGKSVAADCIRDHFGLVTAMPISDQIRIDLENAGIPQTRDSLHQHANAMRAQHGSGYWIDRVLNAIVNRDNYDAIIIDGIRNAGEIITLRSRVSPVVVFGFHADASIRIERVRRRNRDVDDISNDELVRVMNEEVVNEGQHGLQIDLCYEMSDIKIDSGRGADLVRKFCFEMQFF